jgi:hypothetical protein
VKGSRCGRKSKLLEKPVDSRRKYPATLQLMAMQNNAIRLFRGPLFAACAGACCLWAGVLQAANTTAPKNPTIKSSQDISAELDRETNLQAQLDRTLGPISIAIKETVAGARRVKQHYRAGTPEYNQARELYAHVRQKMGKLEGELTSAVQTVQQQDRGESAGRVNRQVIADVNDALQKFDDLINRVAPAPSPEQPKGPAPPPPPQAGQPSGQPTPPGLSVEPVQPEQYVQAQPQPGQVSAEVVVQVCNLFVEHTVGLGDGSASNVRGQMIRQIRRQVSLPDFAST